LSYYLGHGLFKITYLTTWQNKSFALRFAAHNAKLHPNPSRDPSWKRVRDEFLKDWAKGGRRDFCHKSITRGFGNCNENNTIADVQELLYSFDLVKEVLAESTDRWCWPVKWLMDAIEGIIFFVQKGLLVKCQVYDNFDEFGISSITGDLKQPDLGKIAVEPEPYRVWNYEYCECANPPCHLPPRCAVMHQIQEWAMKDCERNSDQILCRDVCNLTGFYGLEKLAFTYIMKSFGEELLSLPHVKEHAISEQIRFLLFQETHLDFPLPNFALQQIKTLWRVHNGNECVTSTFDRFMDDLKTRLMMQKRDSVGFGYFLSKVNGKTVREMVQIDTEIGQLREQHHLSND